MKVKVIAVPFEEASRNFNNQELQAFLQNKRILSFSDHLLQTSAGAFLTLVIGYEELNGQNTVHEDATAEKKSPPANGNEKGCSTSAQPEIGSAPANCPATKNAPQNGGGQGRNDSPRSSAPLPDLPPGQMKIFGLMRKWRMNRANYKNIKPYEICSNQELVEIIRRMPKNEAELAQINGMDETKRKYHGAQLLAELHRLAGTLSTTHQEQAV